MKSIKKLTSLIFDSHAKLVNKNKISNISKVLA
jgi:hypothetical protein